jgi:hypothetical protein
MAVWIIIGAAGHHDAGKLLGCRIEVTPRPGGATYQFLPPRSVGNGALGSTDSNPPRFTGIHYQGGTWSLFSNTAPPVAGVWNGFFTNSTVDPATGEGTWTAEAGGGGPEDEDDSEETEAGGTYEGNAQ